MKKKIISIALALVLGLSILAFVGCGSDSELLRRIEQLEQELESIRELDGIPGPKGEQGPAGQDGRPGQDADCECPPPVTYRVYQLGQTFTYHSMGMPMFSIRVELQGGEPVAWVTNHSIPNFRAGHFIRARGELGSTFTLSTTSAIPAETPSVFGLWITTTSYIWFGFPIDENSIIPYAIFNILSN